MAMNTQIRQTIAALAAMAALSSCATTDDGSRIARETYNDCFFAVSLSDWRPLDDENIILFAGRRNPYHAQLSRPAFNLRRGLEIGVYDRDGRVCPYGGDAIVIRGMMPDTIRISSMRRIELEELDQLLVSFGITEPADVEVTSVEIVDETTEGNDATADNP
jgi:hypothetical protein